MSNRLSQWPTLSGRLTAIEVVAAGGVAATFAAMDDATFAVDDRPATLAAVDVPVSDATPTEDKSVDAFRRVGGPGALPLPLREDKDDDGPDNELACKADVFEAGGWAADEGAWGAEAEAGAGTSGGRTTLGCCACHSTLRFCQLERERLRHRRVASSPSHLSRRATRPCCSGPTRAGSDEPCRRG